MSRLYLVLAALCICTGCQAVADFLSANQETVEAGGAAAGAMISTALGLPPGVGEAIGAVVTGKILGWVGARDPKPEPKPA